MARVTTIICDFDGKTKFEPGRNGVEDFKFEVGGKSYLLDLSDKGKAAFDGVMAEVENIRKEADKKAAELLAQFADRARPAPLTNIEKANLAREYTRKAKDYFDTQSVAYNKQGKLKEVFYVRYEKETGDMRPDFMRK